MKQKRKVTKICDKYGLKRKGLITVTAELKKNSFIKLVKEI